MGTRETVRGREEGETRRCAEPAGAGIGRRAPRAPPPRHRGRSRRRCQPKHRARPGRSPRPRRPRTEAFIHGEASSRRAPSSPPLPLPRSRAAAATHARERPGRKERLRRPPRAPAAPRPGGRERGSARGGRRGGRPRALPRAWPAARPDAAAAAPPAPRPPWLRGGRGARPAPPCACAAGAAPPAGLASGRSRPHGGAEGRRWRGRALPRGLGGLPPALLSLRRWPKERGVRAVWRRSGVGAAGGR